MAYAVRRLADIPTFGRDGHALLTSNWGLGSSHLALLGGWNPGDTEEEQDYFDRTRSSDVFTCSSFANLEKGVLTRRLRRAPWSPRHNFGAVDVSGTIHLFMSDVQEGYYLNDHWTSGSPTVWKRELPTNAGGTMPVTDRVLSIPAVLPNGTPLIIGGETYPGVVGPSGHAQVRREDIWGLIAGTWTQIIANCPALPLSAIQKAVIHNVGGTDYLYLFTGGNYDRDDLSLSVWRCVVSDLATSGSWTEMTAAAEYPGRIYSCIESWGGLLWVICGYGAANNLGDIWSSADHGATWTDTGLTIPARHAAASCVWDQGGSSRIVIIGGSGDDHRKKDVWVIEEE